MHEPASNRRWTRPFSFLLEVRQELARVTWPARREVFAYSVVVMVAILSLGLLILVLDVLLSRLSLVFFER